MALCTFIRITIISTMLSSKQLYYTLLWHYKFINKSFERTQTKRSHKCKTQWTAIIHHFYKVAGCKTHTINLFCLFCQRNHCILYLWLSSALLTFELLILLRICDEKPNTSWRHASLKLRVVQCPYFLSPISSYFSPSFISPILH